ncbi:MAG: winged helix-turn-helix transcriptional regulator [Coriobacteriales bacterium]|jgi:ATP-dependent DNA helicase RecG|nr:winged helix-turn-helix transcriptional regulator [Coriobacteriales bacterium]
MARILEYMADNADITLDLLAQELSVDRSTVRRNIKKLQEIGLVKRTGSDKTGYWTVSSAALSVLSAASKQ